VTPFLCIPPPAAVRRDVLGQQHVCHLVERVHAGNLPDEIVRVLRYCCWIRERHEAPLMDKLDLM